MCVWVTEARGLGVECDARPLYCTKWPHWGKPGQAWPHTDEFVVEFLYTSATCIHPPINHLQLILDISRHSLIQKWFTNNSMSWRYKPKTVDLLDGDSEDGNHSWTYLFNGYHMAKGFIYQCHCCPTHSSCVEITPMSHGQCAMRNIHRSYVCWGWHA